MAKYANLKKLGSGGFGEVFSCRRDVDGEVFAKKTLLATDAEAESRFKREVRMLAQLDHPRIVKVVARHLSSSPLWYVMPLYKRSLRQEFPGIVGDEHRIRPVFGSILDGMHYAHEQGVIHRDLKPENTLLNSDSDVAISDFGLGRAMDSLSQRDTLTGVAFGTPGYVAPEQATDAKNADKRSDVFTLGRMLYEIYTGESPSAVQDLALLPPAIAQIVERCTKSDPDQRFQDAGELRTALATVWVATDLETDEGVVRGHLATAAALGALDAAGVSELAGCLDRLRDNTDLNQDVCIGLPDPVVRDLWAANPHLVRHMVNAFAEQVAEQGWGFSHVDVLGDACAKLARAIDDAAVRARIVFAIVEVSVSHNRWGVMDQAAHLLATYTSPAEDLAIAQALQPIKHRVRELQQRVKSGAPGAAVAKLLK